MSGSSWVRRRSSTGVRSAPPPNHWLEVTTMRVFMCTVGTCGLTGWAISEMPEAQKRGSSSAPGICLRNSGENSPWTVDVCTPTFSKTRPYIIDMRPPPPLPSSRCQSLAVKRPGSRSAKGPDSSSSRVSKEVQIVSRRLSNQARAAAFFSSMSSGRPFASTGRSMSSPSTSSRNSFRTNEYQVKSQATISGRGCPRKFD